MLFASPGEPGSTYKRLQARLLALDGPRERVNALWERFRPHADVNFVSEFRCDPHARYWEMYLTCTLMERGYDIVCPKPGPDVCVRGQGSTPIWVEAVAPGQGDDTSSDRVPNFDLGQIVSVSEYPQEKLILRYRNAIENKCEALLKYIESGIVGAEDPFVIAVSGAKLEVAFDGTDAPDIVKTVLPVGNRQFHIRLPDGECVGSDFTLRTEIPKSSGGPVRTTIFLDDSYAGVSAVLFSNSSVLNPPGVAGEEFILVHNPLAKNPLPRPWLHFGSEYKPEIEGDVLTWPCLEHEIRSG